MDISTFPDHLKSLPEYRGQIVHVQKLPQRSASYAELERPLHPDLEQALRNAGVFPLYTHQAAAVDATVAGKNVIVVTPAASGKSLCYNIPVLQALLRDRMARALYLFPTKALAQDQLRSLNSLASRLPNEIRMATFDGDTPHEERPTVKRRAQIVITNPDMLHLGILPNHNTWSTFFRRLKFIVLDEAHVYRGVFGSNVGNILRRLRRILDMYQAKPQFILASATIANPQEHAETLTGVPFEVVDTDGSPHGEKEFIFWNPPVIDERQSARRSANSESALLLAELVKHNIRTIDFTRTRKLTELIYSYARQQLGTGSEPAEKISPYRGGYLPEDRRRIERDLFEGALIGVVATNALELGIDVGNLDATVLTGYPGSIAATWQQAGRSGRRSGESLSILIGLDNPLDQYFMRHPSTLFGKRFESALTDPDNRYVLKSHLLCAAWEAPITERDAKYWGPGFQNVLEELQSAGFLRTKQAKTYLVPTITYPAEAVNVRSSWSSYFTIVDASNGMRPIETLEPSAALSQAHPGAVYLHQGRSYLINRLDLASRTAYASPTDVPYYTQAKELTDLRIVSTARERQIGPVKGFYGDVDVTSAVIGFRKKLQYSEEVLGEETLDLPTQSFQTSALWFDIPAQALERIAELKLDCAGGLHAAEHASIGILPLFALCDRDDLGGVSTLFHPDTGKAQIFIHDAHPGGTGIAEKGFGLMYDLWQETLRVINECPCEDGCPGCIQSPKCGNNNQPLDKQAARIILEELLS